VASLLEKSILRFLSLDTMSEHLITKIKKKKLLNVVVKVMNITKEAYIRI
jgi:hypothetical protein